MLNAFRQSKEFHGHSYWLLRGAFLCAQRLSAIKGISLICLATVLRPRRMCSTPFGNQRNFTVRLISLLEWPCRVLNAFRQSKEFHYFSDRDIFQILRSAQRLSAIKGISHIKPPSSFEKRAVLNAFRQSKEFHGGVVT